MKYEDFPNHLRVSGPGKKQLLEMKMGWKMRNYAMRKYAEFLPKAEQRHGPWTSAFPSTGRPLHGMW